MTGLAALHNRMLQSLHDSGQRQRALVLATDIVERMTANPLATAAGQYVLASTDQLSAGDCAANCSPQAFAQMDLAEWQQLVSTQLPDGSSFVTRAGDGYFVTVAWRPSLPGHDTTCPEPTPLPAMGACLQLEIRL